MDKREEKILHNVEEYGWQVCHIFDADGNEPYFSYTLGLYETFGHPELIVIGQKRELCQTILNNLGEHIKDGDKFVAGQACENILEGYVCHLVEVAKIHFDEYVGQAIDFYGGSNFPLLQVVWPAVETRNYP